MSAQVGNLYDKFGSTNPLVRWLMRRFLAAVDCGVRQAAPSSLLEVGCGEGHLVAHLKRQFPEIATYAACDLSLDRLVPSLHTEVECRVASAYALPYGNGSFDLVLCSEVLEHLDDPERALAELCRVSRRYVLVSTPREPLFRILNVLRGAYWADWGNTPGHVQHFSRKSLTVWLKRRLRIVQIACPLPWVVVLGENIPHP